MNFFNKNRNNINSKENMTMQNAEERKMTLEIAGVATDAFVSLKLANGETIKINGNGRVDTADLSKIVGADIANAKLYRRWVMAQWFRQYNSKSGYAQAVASMPISYQWKMIGKELETLVKLEKRDNKYLQERTFSLTYRL